MIAELDQRLISALRHDARASLSDLALLLGVSRTTVRSRMEKLKNAGEILGFSVVLKNDVKADPVRGVMLIGVQGRGAERVMRMFDRDRSGGLSFMEFKEAHQFIKSMSDGFKARDRDNSGVLEGHEVRAALQASGYQLQEGTFQIMMKKFDHEQVGGLRFDDYIALSIQLGTVRNVFAFYDRQRQGSVTFNFDTFLTATLTCS